MPRISSCSIDSNCPHKKNRAAPIGLHDFYLVILVNYFTSSTLTDYQCVSTGCCTHVAKTEITIDNQHVTKSLQRYIFLPKQPKENTEKITNLSHFLDLDRLWIAEITRTRRYKNLPILTTFSREACLGHIKYLPLLALSYSRIPVKELYDLFLWQITSKLNMLLDVTDYQCII